MRQTLNGWLFGKHLEDDEVVSAVMHAHWMIGLQSLFFPVLVTISSLGLLGGSLLRETSGLISILIAVGAFCSILWLLREFFDYYLDTWIITNKGIIDLEWHGWFHRESARVLYSDIQGVSYEIKGVWSTLLRYGTVSVEKISTGSSISLSFVAHPQQLESLILKNMEAYLHTKNMKDSRHVQEILAGMVANHEQHAQVSAKVKPSAPNAAPTMDGPAPAPGKKRQPFQAKRI